MSCILQCVPPSHVLFPPIFNDLFVEISIEKSWSIYAIGFNHLKRLSKERCYSSS